MCQRSQAVKFEPGVNSVNDLYGLYAAPNRAESSREMEDKHGVLMAGQLTVYPGQSSAKGNATPSISSMSGPAPSQHFRKEPHSVVAELTALDGYNHF